MRVTTALLWIAAAACSSSRSGGDGSFSIADQISATVTMSDGAGDTTSSAWIVLASTSNLCADASASPPIDRKGQRYITLQLSDVTMGSATTPTTPGTYTIYPNTGTQPPKEALLSTGGYDTSCQPVDADTASGESGTVTLSSVAGNVFSGSYDVVLNTGDEIKGSFAPSACPALATAATSTTTPSCQ